MSTPPIPRDATDPLSVSISRIATTFATALAEALTGLVDVTAQRAGASAARGVGTGEDRDARQSAIDSMFAEYRDALGDLATTLPAIAQRVASLARPDGGVALIFRLRPPEAGASAEAQSLAEQWRIVLSPFVRALTESAPLAGAASPDAVTETRAVIDRFTAHAGGAPSAMEILVAHFAGQDRRDLPQMLEELKHAVRADRTAGLQVSRERLAWLFDRGGAAVADAYAMLDALDRVLGVRCMDEVLRSRRILENAWVGLGTPADAEWGKAIESCFKAIGHPLSPRYSMLPANSGRYREFLVLDHGRDRAFRVGVDPTAKSVSSLGENKTRKPSHAPPVNLPGEVTVHARGEGYAYGIDHAPRLLPHRVKDARQGMVIWTVSRRAIQDRLDTLDTDVRMRAWDMGADRTPLALFVVHYRESDLGEYYEIGMGCFVAPRHDPFAVGMLVLDELPVSTPLSAEEGRRIWGYDKTHDKNDAWHVDYGRERVEWNYAQAKRGVQLQLALPRGGNRSSSQVPLLSYTRKAGEWHASMLSRSGTGERLRPGGRGVVLDLRPTSSSSRAPMSSIPGSSQGLLGALFEFGLVDPLTGHLDRAPAFTLWTEHMEGELGPPRLVIPRPEREHR